MEKDVEQADLAPLEVIKQRISLLPSKIATMGFDGFIDNVVRVIRHKDHHGTTYFESIRELGEYIVEKHDMNFSLETEEITTKLGGNMPITANALARLGPKVSCIGSLGYPDPHPVFRQMSPNCELYSFANPGISQVMEFRRGKMMVYGMDALSRIEWELIRETIGREALRMLFSTSDLIALLNWSELDNSTAVWKGLLKDILPESVRPVRPIGFFDLSDCSKRTDASIAEALDLLKKFSAYWDVVLSLNLNEATIVHSVLAGRKQTNTEAEKMCEDIFENLNIHTLIIHHAQEAVARTVDGIHKRKSFFVREPVISGGSGDNFNAGFCMGRLMDLDTGTSLVLGHATASLYMQSAESPAAKDVVEFISNNMQGL